MSAFVIAIALLGAAWMITSVLEDIANALESIAETMNPEEELEESEANAQKEVE